MPGKLTENSFLFDNSFAFSVLTNLELGGSQYKHIFFIFSWGFGASVAFWRGLVLIWRDSVLYVSDSDKGLTHCKATLLRPVERKMLYCRTFFWVEKLLPQHYFVLMMERRSHHTNQQTLFRIWYSFHTHNRNSHGTADTYSIPVLVYHS